MSGASNYIENAFLSALLREAAFQSPTDIYVGLHTAEPDDDGSNECNSGNWPSYVRRDVSAGGSLSAAWSAPSDGVSTNTQSLIFPVFDGSSITITHFSLWDAATGGNLLCKGPLSESLEVLPGRLFVVDPGRITVTLA